MTKSLKVKDSTELILYSKRTWPRLLILLVGLSFLFGAGFFYFHHQMTMSVGLLAAAFCFPLLIGIIESNLAPVLTIDQQGIFDRRLGVGCIQWNHIESAQLEIKYNNYYICLRVNPADEYIAHLSGHKRDNVIHNRKLGFTLFNVDVQGLDIHLLDLMAHIQNMADQHRNKSILTNRTKNKDHV